MVCPRCCGTGALPAEVAVLPASRRVTLLRTAAAPLQPLEGAQPSQALVLRHVVCEGLGRRGVVSLGPLLLLGGASRAAPSAEQLLGDPPSSPAGAGSPPLPLVTYRDEGGRFSLGAPALRRHLLVQTVLTARARAARRLGRRGQGWRHGALPGPAGQAVHARRHSEVRGEDAASSLCAFVCSRCSRAHAQPCHNHLPAPVRHAAGGDRQAGES